MGQLISILRTSSLIAFIVSIVLLVLVIKYLIKVPKALESINNTLSSMQPKKDKAPMIEVSDES